MNVTFCYIRQCFPFQIVFHLFPLWGELFYTEVTRITLQSNSLGMPNPLAGQYNRNVDTRRLHYRERITPLTIEYRDTLEWLMYLRNHRFICATIVRTWKNNWQLKPRFIITRHIKGEITRLRRVLYLIGNKGPRIR